MNALTKIYCPKCQQPIEMDGDLLGEQIMCPGCGHDFTPFAQGEAAPIKTAYQEAWTPEEKKLISRKSIADRARDRAYDFRNGAFLLLAISVCAFIIGCALAMMGQGEAGTDTASSGPAFLVSSISIKAAAVLYIIHLLIHIRANTEK
jgi:hypothetical protein